MRTLIAGLLLLFPAAALAGGYTIPNEVAREIGLSQSTVAAQNGPEAVYQNPAALAGPQGFAASVNLELLANKTSWSDPTLGSASTENSPNFPPAIFVSYGGTLGERTWGVGAGFHVAGGGSLDWPKNWPARRASRP
jgi:long-subunit fatty acid transport protein